ncbi:hypothetical protein N9B21_02160 [Verrucomicrobiales bacterium]|nr:hypothetical protein [Verrucomicrobiales bacterium]MDA7926820.1 hypothetical protein [Verrucomicrobiales bacterium]
MKKYGVLSEKNERFAIPDDTFPSSQTYSEACDLPKMGHGALK